MTGGRSLSLLLAFVSGFVDTAVFVAMGGLFVAHVTGNFVLLGATIAGAGLAGHGAAATLQLIAFPIFFVAAMFAAGLAGRLPRQRRTPALLWLAAGLTGLAGAAAFVPAAPAAMLAMLLVVAMAVLNAAHRMDGSLGPPFTVMTGNVTAVAIAAAQRLRLAPADREGPAGASAATMLLLVLAFALGCAAGAWAEPWLGLGAMVVPAALLALRLLIGR